MDYKDSIKKGLVGLIVLIAAAVVITMVIYPFYKNRKGSQDAQTAEKTELKKEIVDKSKLPSKLPTNVPVEANSEVLENYNLQNLDGQSQATRSFESNKTLEQNLAIYKDYMTKNNWSGIAVLDQDALKVISGSKGNQKLQVSISKSPKPPTVSIVSISITELPK